LSIHAYFKIVMSEKDFITLSAVFDVFHFHPKYSKSNALTHEGFNDFLKYLFVAELCLQMDTLVAKAYIFKKPCSLLREIEFLNSKTQMHIK